MLTALTILIASLGQPVLEVEPVDARLSCEKSGLVPGATTYVALELEIDPGWHVYWNGENDTGLAPSVKWDLPAGVKAGELLWPAPHRYVSPGSILDHVYETRLTLMAPLTVAKDVEIGSTLTLACKVSWMVCDEYCMLGGEDLSMTLAVVEEAEPSVDAPAYKTTRKRLPKPLSDDVTLTWQDRTLLIEVPKASAVTFYPARDGVDFEDLLKDGHAEGSSLSLRTSGEGAVKGVVEILMSDGHTLIYELNEPMP